MIVLFKDATQLVVSGYVASPQDPIAFPNQGQIATNDLRWAAYYQSLPVLMRNGLPAPTMT